MQENGETFDKWRKMIARTNLYFVIFNFAVEFFMYFILLKSNLIIQAIPVYIVVFLILPSTANVLVVLIGNIILKHVSTDFKFINYIPVIQMAFLALIVASTHFVFPITLSFFCFPMYITVIFGNKSMTRNVEILCGIFMTIALFIRKFSPFKMKIDNKFVPEAIIAFAILIASGIICSLLIKYQNEKREIISKGHLQQLDLLDQIKKDQKTGLYGHGMLMNTLYKMVNSSQITNDRFTLAIIDIDDFKKVNDTHGHLRGDKVILTLSTLMQQNNCENCFLSRFGGEEFAIIFSKIDEEYAFGFLENLRMEFEKQTFCLNSDAITLSAGIASWKPGLNSDELFNNADSAMYVAKTSGKNRTVIYE